MNREQWERQERRHTVLGITSLLISLGLGIACLSMNKVVFIAFLISCSISLIIAVTEGEQCYPENTK
jgi:hypothetical protein